MLVIPTVPYSQEEMGKIISLRVEEVSACVFVFYFATQASLLQECVKLDPKAMQVRLNGFLLLRLIGSLSRSC